MFLFFLFRLKWKREMLLPAVWPYCCRYIIFLFSLHRVRVCTLQFHTPTLPLINLFIPSYSVVTSFAAPFFQYNISLFPTIQTPFPYFRLANSWIRKIPTKSYETSLFLVWPVSCLYSTAPFCLCIASY